MTDSEPSEDGESLENNYEKGIAKLWEELFLGKRSYGEALEKIRQISQISTVSLNCVKGCNLNCKHCFYSPDISYERSLSIEEWQTVIDEFVELGVDHFHVSGKEPLISKNTYKILDYLQEHRSQLTYGLITNGIALDDNLSEIRQASLDYIDFSLDGTKDSHNFLRGEGTFNKTFNNIVTSRNEDLADTFYVSTVAYKRNTNDIINLFEVLTDKAKINNFFVQPFQAHGKGEQISDLQLSPKEYAKLINKIAQYLKRENIKK